MTAVYVDGSKLKGRWAYHNGQIVLEWGYKHKCDEGPPVVCTPDWGGGIRAVLSVGTRFWRTSYAKWVQKKWAYEETHANARLVGVDVAPILPFVQPWQPLDLNLIVREQEEGPQGLGKRTQTIHISEFFDIYDVHKYFTYTPALVEERFDALLDPSKPRPATPVVQITPTRFALAPSPRPASSSFASTASSPTKSTRPAGWGTSAPAKSLRRRAGCPVRERAKLCLNERDS